MVLTCDLVWQRCCIETAIMEEFQTIMYCIYLLNTGAISYAFIIADQVATDVVSMPSMPFCAQGV